MPTLIVEDVPPEVYERLQRQAAVEKRTLPQEMLHLLQQALQEEDNPPPRLPDFIPYSGPRKLDHRVSYSVVQFSGSTIHWKTARTALTRIREAFALQALKPHTFFIGAAIEAKMAAEIWQMLKTGILENAANLTDEVQRTSFTNWLCRL